MNDEPMSALHTHHASQLPFQQDKINDHVTSPSDHDVNHHTTPSSAPTRGKVGTQKTHRRSPAENTGAKNAGGRLQEKKRCTHGGGR